MCSKSSQPHRPARRLWTLLSLMLGVIGCQTVGNEEKSARSETAVATPVITIRPEETSQEDRQQLRSYLEVFYSGKPKAWQQAREKILAMGPLGVEALCLFMLKFFGAGRDNAPVAVEADDFSQLWRAAQRELALLNEQAVPYVLMTMAHPKIGATGRMLCAITLAKIGQPAVPLLLENLTKGTHEFRRMVIEALGSIGDAAAIEPIVALYRALPRPLSTKDAELEDATADLRQYCMKALGKMKTAQALPGIGEGLDDPNTDVKIKAIEAALSFRTYAALPLLEKAVQTNQRFNLGLGVELQRAISQLQGN